MMRIKLSLKIEDYVYYKLSNKNYERKFYKTDFCFYLKFKSETAMIDLIRID